MMVLFSRGLLFGCLLGQHYLASSKAFQSSRILTGIITKGYLPGGATNNGGGREKSNL